MSIAAALAAQPVLAPTPLPVHIVDEGSFFLTYVIPTLSTVAAIVGAWAAIMALRSLKLSQEALNVAKREAEAAEKERSRRPQLRLLLNGRFDDATATLYSTEGSPRSTFWCNVALENVGDRAARSISVDLRLPNAIHDNSPDYDVERLEEGGERLISFDYEVDGTRRAILPVAGVSIPGVKAAYVGSVFGFSVPGTYEIPWATISEEGAWHGAARLTLVPDEDDHRPTASPPPPAR